MKTTDDIAPSSPTAPATFDFASVPWYANAVVYEQFRNDSADPETFFDSHDQWLLKALEHERQAERYGVSIIRIRMDKREFDQWCRSNPSVNDIEGRSGYAEYRANQIF